MKRGAETPRSRSSVAFTREARCCRRRRPAPDAPCCTRRTSSLRLRETRSTCRRGSTPGATRPPRLVAGVNAFRCDPALASATKIWLDGIAIGILAAIAREGDARAVGRPRGRRLVPLAGRQAIELLGRDVEQIDVAVTAGQQISLTILLVLVAIDHDRLRRAAPASVAAAPRCAGAFSASGSGSPMTSASRFESGDHS